MALASDLMGYGVPPAVARHTTAGGTGPVAAVAAGTTWATATLLKNNQYFVSVTGATGADGVALPVAALPADAFKVNNRGTANLVVYAPVGVVISVGGTATSYANVASHTTAIFYSITSSAWCGLLGAS